MEVFFDNPGSNTPSSQIQRGVKREREEDDNVGLCLDGDEQSLPMNNSVNSMANNIKTENAAPVAAPLPSDDQDKEGLKRAYDDALAARGLISVSRSSEKLTDLALPAKMQRTISQEYLKSMNSGGAPTTFTSFSFNSNPAPVPQSIPNQGLGSDKSTSNTTTQQFTHPGQQLQQQSRPLSCPNHLQHFNQNVTLASNSANSSVEVPATTKCCICGHVNVDTQLRPCGCMFHGRCLKPSLQNTVGPPKCPIDNITMQSAVLAVPVDDNPNNDGNVSKSVSSTSYTATKTAGASPTTAPLTSQQEVTNTSSV